MLYLAFKTVHVAAAAVWIGSVVTLLTLNVRLQHSPDRAFLRGVAREAEFIGGRVMGPSAGLTLLAGGAAIWVGHLGFPPWAMWGVGIWLVIVALGAGVIPRVGRRLASRLDEGAAEGEVRDLQERLGRYQWIALLLLGVVVVLMVFKPVP